MTVAPGVNVVVEQVVGICGSNLVFTKKSKFTNTNN